MQKLIIFIIPTFSDHFPVFCPSVIHLSVCLPHLLCQYPSASDICVPWSSLISWTLFLKQSISHFVCFIYVKQQYWRWVSTWDTSPLVTFPMSLIVVILRMFVQWPFIIASNILCIIYLTFLRTVDWRKNMFDTFVNKMAWLFCFRIAKVHGSHVCYHSSFYCFVLVFIIINTFFFNQTSCRKFRLSKWFCCWMGGSASFYWFVVIVFIINTFN